jgi:uncharacterized protein (TIGR03435 family)
MTSSYVASSASPRKGAGAWLALLMCVMAVFFAALTSRAQAPAAKGVDDTWQGTLHLQQRDIRSVLKVSRGADGALTGTMYPSIDQGGQSIKTSSLSFQDGTLKLAIQAMDLTYEGKLSADGKSITGTATLTNQSIPLVFERATPETAWTIPEAPKPIPPMAADAKPVFEVMTIKPSPPEQQGKLFTVRGGSFVTINTTLMDLIKFAYGVQDKQVANLPDWASSQKFDLDGKPDVPGMPDPDQLRNMVKQALGDRFQLKFHDDKKEMSAYVLSVAKGGEKMKKSDPDAGPLPGLFFRGLGVLTVTNATMEDFCHLMQSAVLDRPVVDQTELQGRYNFLLKWTPDESQFGGMGIKVPPPSDAADAPPPLYTAITEQIGLKLEAGKAPVQVLVVDHVDHPSAN